MNANLPSGRTGQVIAVLLLLLTVTAVWRLLAVPLIDLYEVRRLDLEIRSMQAAHLTVLADALPRLKESLGSAPPPPVMTLNGATDSIAAASLQGTIQDMVKAVGASLGSVEIVPPEMAEGLRRIGLKVALSGSSETMTRLLLAIDQSAPPMLVDDLRISGKTPEPSGKEPRSDVRLETSFSVYAFRQSPAEESQP